MKTNTTILTVLTYIVLFSSLAVLVNDINSFFQDRNESFYQWAKTASKDESWSTTKNALQWSYFFINSALFFLKGYLIYGFTYLLNILRELELGNYFSEKNIAAFKKMGSVCVYYVIATVIIRGVQIAINRDSLHLFSQFKQELTFLIPCGLAFYILAEVFYNAKNLKDENDLTV
ncbi:MAG: DUF2975 domain-containing protein [Algicola sp.]|nr:DUF2975 domain-containing protein [Algicola sp.]